MSEEKAPEAAEESFEEINVQSWQQKLEVVGSFTCYDIKEEMDYLSTLFVTKSHMYLLRQMPKKKGFGQLILTKPLTEITKITVRRTFPELVTIMYGQAESEEPVAGSSDRLLIPEAEEALYILRDQIIKSKDESPKEPLEESPETPLENEEKTVHSLAEDSVI